MLAPECSNNAERPAPAKELLLAYLPLQSTSGRRITLRSLFANETALRLFSGLDDIYALDHHRI